MPESKKRLHEWMPGARKAYLRTLEYIASEDANTARLVAELSPLSRIDRNQLGHGNAGARRTRAALSGAAHRPWV